MATATYALYASASFHGEVVEESFVPSGQALQIGNSPHLAVPVPAGCEYVARVLWTSPTACSVRDGTGQVHELTPAEDLEIDVGPVSLRLSLVEQFKIRRVEPVSARGSFAWLAVVVMSTLLTMQVGWVRDNWCNIIVVYASNLEGEALQDLQLDWPSCFPQMAEGGAGGALTAEYLARLLREDYDGDDVGYIEDPSKIDRPDADRDVQDVYLPAGHDGPITEMGGAKETSPEPVRSPEEEEIPVPKRSQAEEVPLYADNGTPVPTPVPDEAVDAEDGSADGMEVEVPQEPKEAPDAPSEEEEGWGIPDWYDERDKAVEELEIDLMLRMANHRLRIDPNDLQALSVRSYYEYLAEDHDAALATYDRIIELRPEGAAAYNNKALVYKRREAYTEEENLYRVALTYQPLDFTAMNNLAVNLAHQGRFEEALAVMKELEAIDPDDAYAQLHRSKIYAEMGDEEQAMAYLRKALEGMRELDTLHHIEFRQDIRVDPSFATLRKTERFRATLHEFYGDDTPLQQ